MPYPCLSSFVETAPRLLQGYQGPPSSGKSSYWSQRWFRQAERALWFDIMPEMEFLAWALTCKWRAWVSASLGLWTAQGPNESPHEQSSFLPLHHSWVRCYQIYLFEFLQCVQGGLLHNPLRIFPTLPLPQLAQKSFHLTFKWARFLPGFLWQREEKWRAHKPLDTSLRKP